MVTKDPSDGWAYWCLGQAYFRLEKWEESSAAMQRALDLNPEMKEQIEPYLVAIRKKADKTD